MSISDYYDWSKCDIPFPDVEDFTYCKCGEVYCSDYHGELMAKYGISEHGELNSCDSCNLTFLIWIGKQPLTVEEQEREMLEILKEKYDGK